MHALSDEEQIDRLEKRVDGIDRKIEYLVKDVATKPDRSETRSEFRTLLSVLFAMWATMIFGFVGLVMHVH
jgi:nitrate reductase NapE component